MAPKGKELAVPDPSNYKALVVNTDDLLETIRANVGGGQLSEFDLDRVKIPSGGGVAWEVPTLEGVDVAKEVTGIIVYWKDTRAYWKVAFDQSGGGTPPDCSSPDAEHASGDPGVAVPQDEAGFYLCAACPHAVFGSDPREDSNAQACKAVKQLFVLTEEDLIPIVFSLPPTSLKAANQYFLRLSRAGLPYYRVVTTIGLEPATSGGGIKYSKATFAKSAEIEGEHAERVRAYAEALRPAFERQVVANSSELGG